MAFAKEIRVTDRGQMTFPVKLRRKHRIHKGAKLSVLELGQGVFILTNISSKVAEIGDIFEEHLKNQQISLEELLQEARDVRDKKA